MRVLVVDTALDACQVAVSDGDAVLAGRSEPMTRGHQERLAPMAEQVMAEAGVSFAALDRIGVTVGPGSFTGLRVGLAFAKGLSLALRIPCVGVGCLEALAASAPAGVSAAVIDARQDRVYLQAFQDAVAVDAPELLDIPEALARLSVLGEQGPVKIVGPAASLLGGDADGPTVPDLALLARLVVRAPAPAERPRPLYLRAPDARTIAERSAAASGPG